MTKVVILTSNNLSPLVISGLQEKSVLENIVYVIANKPIIKKEIFQLI